MNRTIFRRFALLIAFALTPFTLAAEGLSQNELDTTVQTLESLGQWEALASLPCDGPYTMGGISHIDHGSSNGGAQTWGCMATGQVTCPTGYSIVNHSHDASPPEGSSCTHTWYCCDFPAVE